MNLEQSRRIREKAIEVRRILEILHKWGIETLGQFGRLNKEEISARLGTEAVRLWERANGKSIRLLKLVQPPESFQESFEFEHEVETIEPLLFMLRRFLQQLSVRLNGVYLVVKELTLRITFADKNSYQHSFKIPQPTNNVDVLFRMLHAHLEDFKSEHPITAVSLDAQPLKPGRQQFGLFETVLRDPAQLSETLARLTGLLGSDRVGTPVLEDTHRSDAFQMKPFSWQLNDEPTMSEPFPRAALRRFRSNVAASVLLEQNKPIHLRSSEVVGRASAQKGPYLGSGNWWDENAWSRIEWDLHLHNGALVRCHQNAHGWKVDGIYD
jgi:protein ImuB